MKPSFLISAVASARCHAVAFLCLIAIGGTAVHAQPWTYPEPHTLFKSDRASFFRYGDCVLSLGDVNRDGVPDLLINTFRRIDNKERYQTWLMFGSRSDAFNPDRRLTLDGYGTMAKGDLNGDGLTDLVVQSFYDTISVYLGCATCPYTIDTTIAWRWTWKDLGWSGSLKDHYLAIGDLNGDGFDDVAIGAPEQWESGQIGKGSVYVCYGDTIPHRVPDIVGRYARANTVFGGNGLWIADVNGDGIKDLVVGNDVPAGQIERSSGFVDVYHGGPNFRIDPEHPDQRLWPDVIPPPIDPVTMRWCLNVLDVNNDGIGDLVTFSHRLGYIFYGGRDGFHKTPDRILPNPDSTWFNFETRAYRIGDINGDTFEDFAVQADYITPSLRWIGLLALYLGGPSGIVSYPTAAAWNPGGGSVIGSSLAPLGDIDGDGVNDFAASYDDDFNAHGFIVFGGYRWERTAVNDLDPPRSFMIRSFPNPFRQEVSIWLETAEQDIESVAIYDISGREVKRLHAENITTTGMLLHWNGRDANDVPAPIGVYYVVAITKPGLLKGKIVKSG